MLSSIERTNKSPIPQNLKEFYSDFKILSETSYYSNYSVMSKGGNREYIARILKIDSSFVQEDYDIAAKMFIREALQIGMSLGPDAIVLESFEVEDKKMGFVMRDCTPLKSLKDQSSLDIEKLIKDVISEMSDLYDKMGLSEININPESISFSKNRSKFFVGDWFSGVPEKSNLKGTRIHNDSIEKKPDTDIYKAPELLQSGDQLAPEPATTRAAEYYAVGLIALEMCKTGQDIVKLPQIAKVDSGMYDIILKALVEDGIKHSEKVKEMIGILLAREPAVRLRIEETLGISRQSIDRWRALSVAQPFTNEERKDSERISQSNKMLILC